MSKHTDDIKLKLAWQTAYELRTCPDSDTLHASQPDGNLQKHLEICHLCREKLEMQQDERSAWSAFRAKFASLAMTPGSGTDKQVGQVWMIDSKFGGWREDGRFMKPPAVLLLAKIESTSGWKVSQLYSDKRLVGSGDVTLNESFGFAQSWNCYSLKDDRFAKFLGAVNLEELEQVLAASVSVHEPAAEGSILSFFRSMEIEVGAFVAVSAVEELLEEWESALQPATLNSWLENLLGSLSQVKGRITESINGWQLPEATSVFDFLAGSQLEHSAGYAADSEAIKEINLVSAEAKGLLVGTLSAIITADEQLDDGTYIVSGRLKEATAETIYLLARLVSGDSVWETERMTIKSGSKAFLIKFKDVPAEMCIINNVRMLLVNP